MALQIHLSRFALHTGMHSHNTNALQNSSAVSEGYMNLLCLGAAEGAGKRRCGISLSLSLSLSFSWSSVKSQKATTLAFFLLHLQVIAPKTGLLATQALLQLIAKIAQQANSLPPVKMLWQIAHCFASQTGYYKRKLPSQCLIAHGFSLLLCSKLALLQI